MNIFFGRNQYACHKKNWDGLTMIILKSILLLKPLHLIYTTDLVTASPSKEAMNLYNF